MRIPPLLMAANVAVVVFLGLMALGVLKAPRDDCSAIQARLSELSRELSDFDQRLTKRVEGYSRTVSKDEFQRALDSLILLGDRVHAIEPRLLELEARLGSDADGRNPPDRDSISLDDLLADPVKLDRRLQTMASRFAPDAFCPKTVEQMMESFLTSGILGDRLRESIPPECLSELYRLVARLKADYLIIQLRQDSWVEKQVEDALESGNYVEAREPVPLTIAPDGGIGVGRIGPDGVRRLFQFSAKEYPELTKFSLLEERARDRFFQSAQDVCRKHGIEAEPPESQEIPAGEEKQPAE